MYLIHLQIFFSWKIKGQDIFFTKIFIYLLFDIDFILSGIVYCIRNNIFQLYIWSKDRNKSSITEFDFKNQFHFVMDTSLLVN